jgi:hypothetical protein
MSKFVHIMMSQAANCTLDSGAQAAACSQIQQVVPIFAKDFGVCPNFDLWLIEQLQLGGVAERQLAVDRLLEQLRDTDKTLTVKRVTLVFAAAEGGVLPSQLLEILFTRALALDVKGMDVLQKLGKWLVSQQGGDRVDAMIAAKLVLSWLALASK